jgi:hypothetical protein
MRLVLQSTTKCVELNGVPARIWEGQTASGIKVHAYIIRIGVAADGDLREFERELQEHRAPSAAVASFPLRLIL